MVNIPMTDPRCFAHQIAASFAPSLLLGAEHSKHFRPFSSQFGFLLQESGYMHIQATKPDTVGEDGGSYTVKSGTDLICQFYA